jgi:dCTP diphosphatase
MDNIIKKLREFNSERDWDKYHTLKNLVMALASEINELCHIYRWKKEDDKLSSDEIISTYREVADIFIFLLILCDKLEMDEEQIKYAIEEKIQRNGEKYPVEKSRGLFDEN